MELSLFNVVSAGAIEALNDATGAPRFKRADFGRFLGMANIRSRFNDIATVSRSEIAAGV